MHCIDFNYVCFWCRFVLWYFCNMIYVYWWMLLVCWMCMLHLHGLFWMAFGLCMFMPWCCFNGLIVIWLCRLALVLQVWCSDGVAGLYHGKPRWCKFGHEGWSLEWSFGMVHGHDMKFCNMVKLKRNVAIWRWFINRFKVRGLTLVNCLIKKSTVDQKSIIGET